MTKAVVFTVCLFLVESILFRASYYDQNRDQGYVDLLVSYEPLHIALHLFAISVSAALTAAFVAGALEYSFQSLFDRFSDVRVVTCPQVRAIAASLDG